MSSFSPSQADAALEEQCPPIAAKDLAAPVPYEITERSIKAPGEPGFGPDAQSFEFRIQIERLGQSLFGSAAQSFGLAAQSFGLRALIERPGQPSLGLRALIERLGQSSSGLAAQSFGLCVQTERLGQSCFGAAVLTFGLTVLTFGLAVQSPGLRAKIGREGPPPEQNGRASHLSLGPESKT
jgi:hypothetical protein